MEDRYSLRLAVAPDAVGIANVARRTWEDTYGGIILPQNQERFLAQWYAPAALQEAMERSGSWFYVAAVQGEVIGFAQFILREARRAELTRIYVLPQWQRKGVGTRLLTEGLAALAAHGAEEVAVQVEKDNAKGIAFYERRGFLHVRELSLELSGQTLAMLEYALPLRA